MRLEVAFAKRQRTHGPAIDVEEPDVEIGIPDRYGDTPAIGRRC